MALIDLSQEIYQGMNVYPGHLKTVIWEHASHEETAKNFEGGFSFRSSGLLMSDHGPTHVDAIAHLDPRDGRADDRRDAARHVLRPGDLRRRVAQRAPRSTSSADDIDAAEAAAGTPVEAGPILLSARAPSTGSTARPTYMSRYPGLDESGEPVAARRA